jgi:hypothetical protein
MTDVFSPSANDIAVYTTDKFGLLKDGTGNSYRTVVKANINGSIDVYSKGTGLFGADELLFQYSPVSNKPDFSKGKFREGPQTALNSFFNSPNSNGQQFLKDAKTKWYQEVNPNAAKRLATLPGYRSIASTTQPRNKPNVDPNAAEAIEQATGTEQTPIEGEDTSQDIQQSYNENFNNLNNVTIEGGKIRGVKEYPSNNNLRYPIDLNLKIQDCIQFTMVEYRPRKLSANAISEGKILTERSVASAKEIGSTVTLPIQPSITDSNIVNWGSETMNAFQGIAAAAAMSTILGDGGTVAEQLSAAKSLITNEKENLKNAIAAYFAGEAASTKGLLTRTTGGIINPNMELLFNGPELRTFSFNFTMSARNSTESKTIKNIIRFFKQGMSVKRASSDLFLKTPHTFAIKYIMGGNKEHPWINKIKECALVNCTVNYTPSGSYATYNDGAMTSYELSLSFNELEPIYDDDYQNASKSFESEIGY